MSSVAVSPASFSATGSNIALLNHWAIPAQIPYTVTTNGYARGPLDPVQFVGANAADGITCAMPSHQKGDLIIVFAWNSSSNSAVDSPVVPASPFGQPDWINLYEDLFAGGRLRIGYLFATQNTHVVGAWINATKMLTAVYRNTKGQTGSFKKVSRVGTGNLSLEYGLVTDLTQISQPFALAFSACLNNDQTPARTLFTARASTSNAGLSAPAIGLSDREIPNGTNTLAVDNQTLTGATGPTSTLTFILEVGVPALEVETGSFTATLNGDIKVRTLTPGLAVFRAELGQVFTSYLSFYNANSGSYSYSGSSAALNQGFSLTAESGSFDLADYTADFQRSLRFLPQSGGIAGTFGSVSFTSGYFTAPQTRAFTSTAASVGVIKDSTIQPQTGIYEASDVNALLQRRIIEAFTGSSFSSIWYQVGFRNDTPSPPTGGPTRPGLDYGGSSRSDPSFLRPDRVLYNSITKSKDLGDVNNFKGTFSGSIGAETGTQTLFFKANILGKANIRIQKNSINKYTDNQISVGVLNADRRPINVNESGFAYKNEILSTEKQEFLEPLPTGTYYFTVSSSLWQKIPFSVDIQVIRFVGLDGNATLTMQPVARFAIAKMIGSATLTGSFESTIPNNDLLKTIPGSVLLANGTRGTLIVPSGVAVGRMVPIARLMMNWKLSGAASGSSANTATLDSAPPQYGGY